MAGDTALSSSAIMTPASNDTRTASTGNGAFCAPGGGSGLRRFLAPLLPAPLVTGTPYPWS